MLLTRCSNLIGQPNIPGWDTKTCRECPDVFFRAVSPRPLVIRACVHVGKIRLARETTNNKPVRNSPVPEPRLEHQQVDHLVLINKAYNVGACLIKALACVPSLAGLSLDQSLSFSALRKGTAVTGNHF